MVEAPKKTEGLQDFFKAQGKKKQKRPAKADNAETTEAKPDDATTSTAASTDAKQADAKQQEASQAKAAQKNTNNFVDSDEEAEADVKLDNTQQAKLNDAKAQAAKKQKDQQQNAEEGWSADKIFGSKETKEESKPADAAASQGQQQKKSGVEGISFGSYMPTFKRQEKGIIDKQSFPDFDGVGKKGGDDKPVFKKDMGYQMDSGSASQTKKQSQNEEKMQMPIFKGRFKIDSGITAEEVQKSKMNYDMSTIKMSAASSKSGPKGNESGTGRGKGRGSGGNSAAFDEDDDFEVVTEKKRGGQRKNNFGGDGGDIAFGERPQFSRGGSGRGGKRF